MIAVAALVCLGGCDAAPRAAPAGRIAFMREGKVWVVDAGGGKARPLTGELRYKANRPLAWSPEGTRLLFWNHRPGGWGVRAMDPDGKNRKNLTNTRSGGCRSPAWAPDGKVIAFLRDDPAGLYLMEADGKKQRLLSKKGHRDEVPAWSPDGKRIAYTDLRSAGKDKVALAIHVIHAVGRNDRCLVDRRVQTARSPQR